MSFLNLVVIIISVTRCAFSKVNITVLNLQSIDDHQRPLSSTQINVTIETGSSTAYDSSQFAISKSSSTESLLEPIHVASAKNKTKSRPILKSLVRSLRADVLNTEKRNSSVRSSPIYDVKNYSVIFGQFWQEYNASANNTLNIQGIVNNIGLTVKNTILLARL
eukprot:79716_1